MDSVYIETTVVGNIAGGLHPDPTMAARQRVTRTWWATATCIRGREHDEPSIATERRVGSVLNASLFGRRRLNRVVRPATRVGLRRIHDNECELSE